MDYVGSTATTELATAAVSDEGGPRLLHQWQRDRQLDQRHRHREQAHHGGGDQASAPSKDIATAVVNYQRKQSKAAKSSGGPDGAAAETGPSHHRGRGGRSRSGRGTNSDRATDKSSAAGPDRESSSSLRIIQHGPSGQASTTNAGRALPPQRLSQRDLDALAETKEAAGEDQDDELGSRHHHGGHHHHHHGGHHHHHHHHDHAHRHQHSKTGDASHAQSGGARGTPHSMARGPSSSGQNDASPKKYGGERGGRGGSSHQQHSHHLHHHHHQHQHHHEPSSPSLGHAPSASIHSGTGGTGGGGASIFSSTGPSGGASVVPGSSTITSLGTPVASTATGTELQQPRTLFDPRRHDPVKFAMAKRLPGLISLSQPPSLASGSVISTNAGTGLNSGAGSLLESSGASISTGGGGSPSVTSSEASRERRRRRAPSSRTTAGGGASSESGAPSEASGTGAGSSSRPGDASAALSGTGGGSSGEGNAYVNEIKRMYKMISTLETQLKEQHAAAAAAGPSLGLTGSGTSGGAAGATLASTAITNGGIHGAQDASNGPSVGSRISAGANDNASKSKSLSGHDTATPASTDVDATVDDGVDHVFWNSLAAQHKNLAELHAAFMEMAWRPNLPASFAALPQTYKTSARLWQTAFHLFLERLRLALPYPSPSHPPPQGDRRGAARQAALLDHLEEFIYFAYAFYSNLHEAETFVRLRTAWTESLGDLARYRMAVAGFRMRLAAWEAREREVVREREKRVAVEAPPSPEPSSAPGGTVAAEEGEAVAGAPARIDDEDVEMAGDEAGSADEVASLSRPQARRRDAAGGRGARVARRVFEAPSIGEAALGDWDLEEKETWRETARGWYAKGLAEIPGTGRLHHHLGILSRGKEELRGLYHFSKSLTTSHPYPPARETLMPMCDREHQMRRLQPGATASELFVHLHAMLFTRIDLDNFEDVFARYKEAIRTSLVNVGPAGLQGSMHSLHIGDEAADRSRSLSPLSDGGESISESKLSEAAWMIFGMVCISALLQYGASDALLFAPPVTTATSTERTESHRSSKSKITQKVKSHTPTAIMLNKDTSAASSSGAGSARSPARSSVGLPAQDDEGDKLTDGREGDQEQEGDDDVDPQTHEAQEDNIVSLQQPAFDPSTIPLTFTYAARVAFDTLEIVIRDGVLARAASSSQSKGRQGQHGGSSAMAELPNPYITMLLTFLLTIVKQPNALTILERWVPWQALTDLTNAGSSGSSSSIIPPASALAEIPSKVTGGMPLPEDWCLRGMSWVSRRVFERGFWKPKPGSEWAALGLPAFESEIDVLDRAEASFDAEIGGGEERDGEEARKGVQGAVPVGTSGRGGSGALTGAPTTAAHTSNSNGPSSSSATTSNPLAHLRWSRIGYAIGSLARTVPGLDARPSRKMGKNALVIVAPLSTKLAEWKAEDEALLAVEETLQAKVMRDNDDDDDGRAQDEAWDEDGDSGSESGMDGEQDASLSEAVRALKDRRRALKKALKNAKEASRSQTPRRAEVKTRKDDHKKAATASSTKPKQPVKTLDAQPGYTVLVLDTNIIVCPAGNLLRSLVESQKWTVILPLAVITELDGLSKNKTEVGEGAKEALKYIETSLRTHSKWLKIQTSRGNYLYNLNVRFEHIDFAGLSPYIEEPDGATDAQQRKTIQARNLDEIILRAAVWQEEHFVNRLPILYADRPAAEREAALQRVGPGTAKVVLITLDRNLRLKARSRGIRAASDVELLDVVVGQEARPNG